MAVTVAQCSDFIDKNLDGGVEVVDVARLINTAGELLYSMRVWKWLRRPMVSLDATNGQSWIALPSDFGRIETLQSSGIIDIEIVPPEIFTAIVRGNEIMPALYAVTMSYVQAESDGEPVPRLEIYPTPSADSDGVMKLWYFAGWETVSSADVSAGTRILAFPAWIDPLWFEILQAVARGFEEDDNAILSQRMAMIQAGPVFDAAIRRDSSTFRILGSLPMQSRLGPTNKLHLIDPTSGVPSA